MGSIKGFKCNCVNPIMYSVGWMYSTKQIHLLLIMKAPPLSSKIWQKIAECLLRYGSTDGLYNLSLINHTFFCYSHGCVKTTVIERRQHQLGRMADFPPLVTFSVFDL